MKYYNCDRCRKTYVIPAKKTPEPQKRLQCSCGDRLKEILLDDAVGEGGVFYKYKEIKEETHAGVYAWMEIGFAVLDSRLAPKGNYCNTPEKIPEVKITPVKGKPTSWRTQDGSEGASI